MGKLTRLVLSFWILLLFMGTPGVHAMELIVSDNGAGSSSEINVKNESNVSVEQTNTASVSNDIDVSSNTGGNTASENVSDEVGITTGDASTALEIQNSLNTSSVNLTNCCIADTQISISGNGKNSNNTVNLNNSTNSNVAVNQNANISNSIEGNSNTGKNKANRNLGDVDIVTGNIVSSVKIINGPVNMASVTIVGGGNGDITVEVFENDEDSENEVNPELTTQTNTFINSSSDINNYVTWENNTGENEASENIGDVEITTGDIDFELLIENITNLSEVEIDNCCDVADPDDPNDPSDPGDPSDPPIGGGGGGGSSSGGGQLLPAAAATEAGGPGIAGLSDTSSGQAKQIFYWLGFALIILGVRSIGRALEERRVALYTSARK